MTNATQASSGVHRPFSRRRLLAGGAAMATVGAVGLHPGAASADDSLVLPGPADSSLVIIYLRGGVDGLSMAVPTSYGHYADVRPTIGVGASEAVALAGAPGWGLHPALGSLVDEWDAGSLAIVHGAGVPNVSRSHFLTMLLTETGVSQPSNLPTGWVGRYLLATGAGQASAHRALEIGRAPARVLGGYPTALALADIASAGIGGRRDLIEASQLAAMDRILGADNDVHLTMDRAIALSTAVEQAVPVPVPYQASPTPFDVALASAAAVLDSPLGTQVVSTTLAARWDSHAAQGNAQSGALQLEFAKLSHALSGFFQDLRTRGIADRVTTVVMTEFGRRVAENGSGGTDHGNGAAMLVHSPGLVGSQLVSVGYDGEPLPPGQPIIVDDRGDVASTTDYRDVLAAAASHALPNADLGVLFPDDGDGYSPSPVALF